MRLVSARCRHHRGSHLDECLAVGGCRGVQVDKVANPVGGPVGDTGDHHAPITVADEDYVAQILEMQQLDDVGDVALEVDTASKQVLPLAQTRQGRGVNLVPLRPQQPRDGLVTPAAVAAAVNQNVGGHPLPFLPIPPSARKMPRRAACLCTNTHARGN